MTMVMMLLRQFRRYKTAIFVARQTFEKTYLAVHFTKGWSFFSQFVEKKIVYLMPKYYLPAGDTSKVSSFFLT